MIRLLILLYFIGTPDPSEIAKINNLKSEAGKAYKNGQYETAALKYSMLYDSMNVEEPEVALNLAHSYYALGDTSNAKASYQNLTTSSNKALKSIAYQQLGVMAKKPETLKQSLAYLKSALKADPTNEEARYNYEVVKKLIKEQEEQQKQNQDQQKDDRDQKDQEQQDQQEKKDQEKQGEEGEKDEKGEEGEEKEQEKPEEGEQKEGEEGEEEEQQQPKEGEKSEEESEDEQQMSTKQKLEDMNISEEKAQMILEAMKSDEIQYIQQQKRKATKPRDSGKPDW